MYILFWYQRDKRKGRSKRKTKKNNAMKVSNHQTKENNDAMKVSNHQTKKNDAMKESNHQTKKNDAMKESNHQTKKNGAMKESSRQYGKAMQERNRRDGKSNESEVKSKTARRGTKQ